MARTLTPLDVEVLELLAQPRQRWWPAAVVADELGVALFQVRGSLQALRRLELVTPARETARTWVWAITTLGVGDLQDRTQLRLVGGDR